MLHIFPTQGDDETGARSRVAPDALWLDLLNPTSAEVRSVEETIGAKLPTLVALSEIESSSRLRSQSGTLYMSTPSAARRPEGAQTLRASRFESLQLHHEVGASLPVSRPGPNGLRRLFCWDDGPWPANVEMRL
jgi:Mg2+ and Co2+ transporter CorA